MFIRVLTYNHVLIYFILLYRKPESLHLRRKLCTDQDALNCNVQATEFLSFTHF